MIAVYLLLIQAMIHNLNFACPLDNSDYLLIPSTTLDTAHHYGVLYNTLFSREEIFAKSENEIFSREDIFAHTGPTVGP